MLHRSSNLDIFVILKDSHGGESPPDKEKSIKLVRFPPVLKSLPYVYSYPKDKT